MARRKISAHAELAEQIHPDDWLIMVDRSDTTMAPTGTTKKIKASNVASAGATGPQGPPGPTGADGAQGPQGDPGPAGADGADAPTLTYPTFVWNQYNGSATYHDAAATDTYDLPLDTSDGATVINPAGWTIDVLGRLLVPDGVYAMTWYWEQEDYGALYFDNYASVSCVGGGELETYPTAPMANPASGWGFGSATLKLDGVANASVNYFKFTVGNNDASPRGVKHIVTITRLDA